MPTNNNNIELRSNDVQEIMSRVPHWMIRWGITLIFAIIALLIFISWFIKYPDVISGNVVVSTKVPTIQFVAKTSGQLTALNFVENERIRVGDIIGTIDNAFSEEARMYLNDLSVQFTEDFEKNVKAFVFSDEELEFGIITETYQTFKSSVLECRNYVENNSSTFEINAIKEQIGNHTMLKAVSNEQLRTAQREVENARKKYETDKRLFDQKVLSQVQLFEKEKELISAETNLGNYKKAVVQSSITITELKTELNKLSKVDAQKQVEFEQRIRSGLMAIQNAVSQWSKNFQLKSPINGTLTYLSRLSIHQFVNAETPLFAVTPDNQEYIGFIDVPKAGFGKIRLGQRVRIKIDKYPDHQFGQLDGIVSDIALIPTQDVYRVSFTLPKGMMSNYGKKFEYTPEMTGTADVITEDIRLLERIFNKFRKILD